MATKKIPISFNEADQAAYKELIDLIGITGVYGDIPKAVKFGINLALAAIKNPGKVYAGLNVSDMEVYFSSMYRYQARLKKLEKAEKLVKEAEKV